jgi:hypothetical protein
MTTLVLAMALVVGLLAGLGGTAGVITVTFDNCSGIAPSYTEKPDVSAPT